MDSEHHLDVITDADFSADLESAETDELRRRRRLCEDEERRVSYQRRLVHARLDLVTYEQRRRRGEETRPLLEAIGEILSDRPRTGGGHVTASTTDTSTFEATLPGGPDFMSASEDHTDEHLDQLITELTDLEQELSAARRRIHEAEGLLGEELRRRYRTDTTSIDELLAE